MHLRGFVSNLAFFTAGRNAKEHAKAEGARRQRRRGLEWTRWANGKWGDERRWGGGGRTRGERSGGWAVDVAARPTHAVPLCAGKSPRGRRQFPPSRQWLRRPESQRGKIREKSRAAAQESETGAGRVTTVLAAARTASRRGSHPAKVAVGGLAPTHSVFPADGWRSLLLRPGTQGVCRVGPAGGGRGS